MNDDEDASALFGGPSLAYNQHASSSAGASALMSACKGFDSSGWTGAGNGMSNGFGTAKGKTWNGAGNEASSGFGTAKGKGFGVGTAADKDGGKPTTPAVAAPTARDRRESNTAAPRKSISSHSGGDEEKESARKRFRGDEDEVDDESARESSGFVGVGLGYDDILEELERGS